MRDLIVTLAVLGSLPFILLRPYVGVLVWSWLGYMNPHRFTWGFAYNFPFSQIVALTTIVAVVLSTDPKRIPWFGVTFIWLLFVVWMNITTVFAIDPEVSVPAWERAMKIQLIAWITLMLINDPQRLRYLIWVIVVSLGFFGVKGGIFSILTGGNYLVMGPPDSMIPENNSLAVALLMTLPLFRFLQLSYTQKWIKYALLAAMALTMLAILTSFSRGALIAILAMGVFMILKTPYRFRIGLVMLVMLPFMFAFMPDAWYERMATIETYRIDSSAMGRINAWYFAYNLVKDFPYMGGGFDTFTAELYIRYAPDPLTVLDSHSIYFEALAEQGFIGLGLFLMLGIMTFRMCSWVIKNTKEHEDLRWAYNLTSMLQISLVAYAVGGIFLGLAYYDLYYHIIGMAVITCGLVKKALAEKNPVEERQFVLAEQPTTEVGVKVTTDAK
ncbi:MAG: putative O-glycosylation ligase, exosortase A system-associated [Gammaproteobacteria bacterium]|nr:putative O-glycosylation ligase, exosortase A system-associated [Gammaproteobacteria bacterium]